MWTTTNADSPSLSRHIGWGDIVVFRINVYKNRSHARFPDRIEHDRTAEQGYPNPCVFLQAEGL
jgi:hypothetical protein